jgi:hypothetical protein
MINLVERIADASARRIDTWRCGCSPEPSFDRGANPLCVRECGRCGWSRPSVESRREYRRRNVELHVRLVKMHLADALRNAARLVDALASREVAGTATR